MRVGYVVKVYPRFSETFVVNEVLALERRGVEVDIFSLRPAPDGRFHELLGEVQAGVSYLPSRGLKAEVLWRDLHDAAVEVPSLWSNLAPAADADAVTAHQAVLLARETRRRGISHLHAHFASDPASVTRLAAQLVDLPYSLTAHAKDIFHEDVEREALRRKLMDAVAVVTVSDFNLRHLRAICPEAAGRIHRIYNGLDLTRFPYVSPEARCPLVVGVGRLVEKKGFDVLIEACELLSREGREFECKIIGEGPLEPVLGRLILERGLERRVRLLGPRTLQEVRCAMAEAAALAVPCVIAADGNRDGLPTVLIEAMALGTPCVSTDVTGIPEIVDDGETGVLVPQGDAGALASALERLLDQPSLRVALARAARAQVESRFDVDRNVTVLETLFSHGASRVTPRPATVEVVPLGSAN